MPPRKSGASTASAADANGEVSMVSNATIATTSPTQHAHPKQSRQSAGGSGKQDDGVGIDDLLLPRSLISRLSRGVLPPNTSLQKDALLALTRSATVFISYLAHHANEQSQLRHRKTLGVQDVYAALKEIELSGQMELGVVGKDGRQGGRLEREVAVYEEAVMRKRKGYREKVKARESGGGEADVEGEDRGEPSTKKARRMSEQEEDEEERMLEQQLNGITVEQDANSGHQHVQGERQSNDADGVSVVVPNGHSKGKEKAIPASDGQDEDEDVDDADEVEDDGDGDDEDEGDDEQGEADEDEDQEGEEDEAADNDDLDDSRLSNGRSRGLLPNGEVEIGSEDESD